jgi:hypothetical protein
MRIPLLAIAFFCFAAPAVAEPPASRPAEPPSAEELAAIMKSLLVAALPDPLVEQSSNWGHQSNVMNGVTWEKDGILLKPHKQKKLKNDGTWRRIKVEAVNPDKNLTLLVRNVQQSEKGRLTFDLVLTLQTRIYFEQQIWKHGVKLYGGSTRARCRPILALQCESTSRAVKTEGALPDVVFRLRVLDAKLHYDQFKVEHTAGVGGDLAEVLGDAIHDMIKQLKPSLERDMLEKANRAIVKAGDTKEVKLGLGRLFDGK